MSDTKYIEATSYTLASGEKVYRVDDKTAIYDGKLPAGYNVDDFFSAGGVYLEKDDDGVEPTFSGVSLWRVVASYQDSNGEWCLQSGEEALGNLWNKAYRSEAEAIEAIEDDMRVVYGDADEFGYIHGAEEL